jgi:hypothetical protein
MEQTASRLYAHMPDVHTKFQSKNFKGRDYFGKVGKTDKIININYQTEYERLEYVDLA